MYEPFSRGYHKGIYFQFLTQNDLDSTLQIILSRCQGFKHITDHLNFNQNIMLLKKLPTIFLYRQNIVNSSLSFLTAQKTKIWHSEQIKDKKKYAKNIQIDPEKFLSRVKKTETENKLYKTAESKSIFLTYEELYGENKMHNIEKCFEFIGEKIINLKETEELLMPENKLNKTPWEKTISNWKEIEDIIIKNNLQMPN